jgi:hypothetical protein
VTAQIHDYLDTHAGFFLRSADMIDHGLPDCRLVVGTIDARVTTVIALAEQYLTIAFQARRPFIRKFHGRIYAKHMTEHTDDTIQVGLNMRLASPQRAKSRSH